MQVGQAGDVLLVVHGPQVKVGLHAAERRLHLLQYIIDFPYRGAVVPVALPVLVIEVGLQEVDSCCLVVVVALLQLPGEGGDSALLLVLSDVDVIVRGDTGVFLLRPAYADEHLVGLLRAVLLRERGGNLSRSASKRLVNCSYMPFSFAAFASERTQ